MKIVIDASVALTWLLRKPGEPEAEAAFAVLARLGETGAEAHMPAVGPLEMANVIARAEARGAVESPLVEAFLALLRALPLRIDHDSTSLALGPTLVLARRHGLSAYDASYLELALRRGFPLVSLDGKLNQAAREAGVPRVELSD